MKMLLVNQSADICGTAVGTSEPGRCGVYQHGLRMKNMLSKDDRYELVYREIDSGDAFLKILGEDNPDVIFYNWHWLTIPWLTADHTRSTQAKQIIYHHEHPGLIPYTFNYDAVLMADMTDIPDARMYSCPRPLLESPLLKDIPKNDIFTVGSFGFGLANKGLDQLVKRVGEQFDEAIVNLHLTSAFYGDAQGHQMLAVSDACRAAARPGIQVNITNHFIPEQDLIDFLRGNHINVFNYDYMSERGLSGAADYAMAVDTPFAINSSHMFRHISSRRPDINWDNYSLKEIYELGLEPVRYFQKLWSTDNFRNKVYDLAVGA